MHEIMHGQIVTAEEYPDLHLLYEGIEYDKWGIPRKDGFSFLEREICTEDGCDYVSEFGFITGGLNHQHETGHKKHRTEGIFYSNSRYSWAWDK